MGQCHSASAASTSRGDDHEEEEEEVRFEEDEETSSMKKRCLSMAKEQRSRFYILRSCLSFLWLRISL
ncbi:hypothetical protein J1N35_030944 [Gossypium stocksii]|uniref:Uncharacterized protein n=1 Tax=Gossypium stocksii TaxID=47602 RepID=A0A9D3V0S7_9ROSI|nr:hypothetical protein J1N35_030944 [Gossypium stocksii]